MRADVAAPTPLLAPAAIRAVDVDAVEDVALTRDGEPYRTAMLVATREGRPLGTVTMAAVPGAGLLRAESVRGALGPLLAGSPAPGDQPAPDPEGESAISVVVTTCACAAAVCETVASVLACRPAVSEVIVVENRPIQSGVRAALAQAFGDDPRVRYVEETRQGLSWARNAGLAAARGELIAFTDDDVLVSRGWAGWLRAAFDAEPAAACVTGLIMPAELETPSQVLLEQYAGFGKGFTRRVFRADEPTSPLFPYAAGEFGSGANTAMRVPAARALGGFDTALGAGTVACGAEDLDLFVRVLLAGHAIVYEPAAMLWHRHPDTAPRLRSEVFRYGLGLSAVLTKFVLTGHARAIAGRALAGLRFLRDPDSRKNERKTAEYPRGLDRWEYAGMLVGPFAYLRSRRGARRLARA
ncbi:MAG: glycosyl transferase family 2 [Solirubrobacterales bacterium]|nr:glycosyl transferase family 2 [Solirubrobacterales bacterium]